MMTDDERKAMDDELEALIEKGTKAWAGVDVDKFLDELRGRDEEPPK